MVSFVPYILSSVCCDITVAGPSRSDQRVVCQPLRMNGIMRLRTHL
jgi:hypothetical protein